tara:strand:- start:353 stop:1465 length:1113 start_codon:yes stop_codon:yes gene_type:complete
MTTMIGVKNAITEAQPYKQGPNDIEGVANPIKLSSNELPYPPSPKAIKAYHNVENVLGRYPDGAQSELRSTLAELHGIPKANIFGGNGSEEAIGLIVRAVLKPGDSIIVSENSFIMTEIYANSVGADVIKCKEVDQRVDVDAILAAVCKRTKIVYLCSPNNPTGTYTSAEELMRLKEGLPDGVLFLMDMAYAEFADASDYSDGLSLFSPEGKVAITRTFSKAYGLASLRIGYAIAPSAVVKAVSGIRTPFNANSAAMAAATAAALDQEYLQNSVAKVRATRDVFVLGLRELGLDVVPSQANFVLIKFASEGTLASSLDASLQSMGILGRPSVAGEKNEYRISIGTDEEMRKTLKVIRGWLKDRRGDGQQL